MFSLFQELSYNSLRGGVSVLTSKGDTSVSSLILQNLDKEDAGTYECQADTVKPAFINVHVLNGDPSLVVQTVTISVSCCRREVLLAGGRDGDQPHLASLVALRHHSGHSHSWDSEDRSGEQTGAARSQSIIGRLVQ